MDMLTIRTEAAVQKRVASPPCPAATLASRAARLINDHAISDQQDQFAASHTGLSAEEIESQLDALERDAAKLQATSVSGALMQAQVLVSVVRQIEDWFQDGETSADLIEGHMAMIQPLLASIYGVLSQQTDDETLRATARYFVRPDWIGHKVGTPAIY